MLWGRSGNRCAFPGCGQLLVADDGGTAPSLVGFEAHIVARARGGPRGIADLTPEERDSLSNLLLLCGTHHKLIDDRPDEYTVERLRDMKRSHEDRFARSEDEDARKLRLDTEVYAEYVDHWAVSLDLDNWTAWTSGLLSHSEPSLERERLEALHRLRPWLLSRVWPGRVEALEGAFANFRLVLDDLAETFDRGVRDMERDVVYTHRYYKIDHWNPKLYGRLLDSYRQHVALVENLTYELTRAANYVCDQVRSTLDPPFRRTQGVLLVQQGRDPDVSKAKFRPIYRDGERTLVPYPGRDKFVRIARTRDYWVRAADL